MPRMQLVEPSPTAYNLPNPSRFARVGRALLASLRLTLKHQPVHSLAWTKVHRHTSLSPQATTSSISPGSSAGM